MNKVDSKPSFKTSWVPRDKQNECTRCGFTGHRSSDDKCPAKGKTCNKCGGRDHFSRRCRTKKRARDPYKSPNADTQSDSKKDESGSNNSETPNKKPKTEDGETVKLVNSSHPNSKDEYIFCFGKNENLFFGNETGNEMSVKIGGVQLTVVLDSGSKFKPGIFSNQTR